jgi:hypothetical protein
MWSFDSAEPPVICADCCLPVPTSLAETFTMPLPPMSKVTAIRLAADAELDRKVACALRWPP